MWVGQYVMRAEPVCRPCQGKEGHGPTTRQAASTGVQGPWAGSPWREESREAGRGIAKRAIMVAVAQKQHDGE